MDFPKHMQNRRPESALFSASGESLCLREGMVPDEKLVRFRCAVSPSVSSNDGSIFHRAGGIVRRVLKNFQRFSSETKILEKRPRSKFQREDFPSLNIRKPTPRKLTGKNFRYSSGKVNISGAVEVRTVVRGSSQGNGISKTD